MTTSIDKLAATIPAVTPTTDGNGASTVKMLTPAGEQVELEPGVVQDALGIGYKPATEENINQFKYGTGIGNQLKAAALGAGEAATFGGTTAALVGSGLVDPNTVKEIEGRNPGSYLAGQAAGIIGPALVGDEAGLAGLGKFLPTNLLSKGAGAITAGSREMMAGSSASKVLKYASDVGSHALGSAVEGAAYGLGNTVTEAVLGDPDLGGEKVLSNIGFGALLGGLGGAGIEGIVKPFAKTALEVAPWAIKKAANVIAGVPEKAMEAYMADPAAINAAAERPIQSIAEDFLDKTKELRIETSQDSGEAYKMLKDSGIKVHPDVFIQPIRDQISRLENLGTYGPERKAAVKKLEALIKDIEDNSVIPNTPIPEGATSAEVPVPPMEPVKEIGLDQGKAIVAELDRTRFEGQPYPGVKAPGADTQALKSYGLARDAIDGTLREMVPGYADHMDALAAKTKAIIGVTGEFRKPQGALNLLKRIVRGKDEWAKRALQAFDESNNTTFLKDLENSYAAEGFTRDTTNGSRKVNLLGSIASGIGTAIGGVPGAVIGAGLGAAAGATLDKFGGQITKAALDPWIKLQKLATVEQMMNATTNAVGTGVKAMFVGGGNARARMSEKNAKDDHESHAEVAQQLNNLVNNPTMLIDKVSAATDPVAAVAPKIAQSMNETAVRATNFLQSKLPTPAPQGLFGKAAPISRAKVAEFNRYFDVINNPVSVLHHAKAGTLTQQHVEALAAVYPKLHNDIKTSIIDHVSGMKDSSKVSYQTRMAISQLVGSPMDISMEQPSIAAAQAAMQSAQPQQPQQGKKPTVKGMGHLHLAEAMKTNFTSAATREK